MSSAERRCKRIPNSGHHPLHKDYRCMLFNFLRVVVADLGILGMSLGRAPSWNFMQFALELRALVAFCTL